VPFNGSGSFSPPAADFPAVASTLIESTKFNSVINDIALGLSTCLTTDGQSTVTANLPMGGQVFTGLGAGAANGQSLRYEQLFSTSAVTLLGAMNWVKGSDIASATTTNLTTATGNGVHITGTTAITAVTLGSGMWRAVIFDGILTLTHHATNNNLPGAANITTAAGDRALYWADGTTVYCVAYIRADGTSIGATSPFVDTNPVVIGSSDATKKARFEVDGLTTATTRVVTVPDRDVTINSLTSLTNSISGDVALNNTGNYFDGPVVAQGTSGTWFVSGSVTLVDTAGAATMNVKLWDGTTVVASSSINLISANTRQCVALSGVITSPAGNLRISVNDATSTSGIIRFNSSANSKDSTITAVRIG